MNGVLIFCLLAISPPGRMRLIEPFVDGILGEEVGLKLVYSKYPRPSALELTQEKSFKSQHACAQWRRCRWAPPYRYSLYIQRASHFSLYIIHTTESFIILLHIQRASKPTLIRGSLLLLGLSDFPRANCWMCSFIVLLAGALWFSIVLFSLYCFHGTDFIVLFLRGLSDFPRANCWMFYSRWETAKKETKSDFC